VGFKNATSGDVQIAIEAMLSAAHPHTFLGHSKHGQSAIFVTNGNPDTHVILRGGNKMVNYTVAAVAEVCAKLEKCKQRAQVMIDCSHANCQKDHTKQGAVCRDVAAQVAAGEERIIGLMIESSLVAGAQKLSPGKALTYGQSITDACIGWEETEGLLKELAAAVKKGRPEGLRAAAK
jgi:3-deoxy-7-phosphoheptulonate synthase